MLLDRPTSADAAIAMLLADPTLEPLIAADFSRSWHASPSVVALGWIETALFWLVAAWIFSRRDLAVARE